MNGGLILNLNLFENLKKEIESNVTIKNFMEDLVNSLSNTNSRTVKNSNNISPEKEIETDKETALDENAKYRKEGHLYFVTEDRNNEIYLWDFTEKSKHEFKEIILSKELLSVAKEGAMLQYKNGKYELYSPYGYDMISNEKKDK